MSSKCHFLQSEPCEEKKCKYYYEKCGCCNFSMLYCPITNDRCRLEKCAWFKPVIFDGRDTQIWDGIEVDNVCAFTYERNCNCNKDKKV